MEVLMLWIVSALALAVVVVSMVSLLKRSGTKPRRRNPHVDRAFEDAATKARQTADRDGLGSSGFF